MNSVRSIAGMVVTAAVICIAGPANIACADEKIITPERTCSLAIHYLDNVDGTDPIAGAEFTYYRVAEYSQEAFDNSTGILWRSVIPIDEKERALLEDGTEAAEIEEQTLESYSGGIPKGGMTGTMKTDANGNAHASGLLQGIYLIRETKSASGHLPSGSFLMAVPFTKTETGSGESVQSWCYEAEAEPKPQPCGELIIVKTVRGSGSDLKTDFHFKVILEEDGPYPCIRADGEEDIISSGDVVALKGGESFLIGNLPAGSRYKVTEQEANQNGYLTTETGTSGRIIRSELARAVFVNEKNVSGAPVSGSPAVTSTPTRTPTPEPTTTSAKTPTPVPTSTPTRKPTPAPTSTPTATPTPEPTSKSTVTPTPSPTGKPKNENTSTDGEKGNTGNKSTGTSGGSYQSTAVKTGDESKAEIWIFLCLISMAAVAFSFIWRRNS